MRQAVAQFPGLLDPDFLASIELAIAEQALPNEKPGWERRVAWLREIANEK
jgi:hypothetical protein